MVEIEGKRYYEWKDYKDDIEQITHIDFDYNHVVSIYRGSLGLGAHLSNVKEIPLSVVKFQTRDGEDKIPTFMHNAGIEAGDKVLIVDDIYDTGLTMDTIKEFLYVEYPTVKFEFICLFGNENSYVKYLRDQNGKWITFPWEI